MNNKLFSILKKANRAYSEGNVYKLTNTDIRTIKAALTIDIECETVTDELYDILYFAAKKTWPDDPFFGRLTSNNTGAGKTIVHKMPMGSMEELKAGDWDKWKAKNDTKAYLVSDKLDGCSVILRYFEGHLCSAATRGRGAKGKCIMRHVPYIMNIPHVIPCLDEVIVRGELLCPKAELADMLKEAEAETGNSLKNGRNTIAGALNKSSSIKSVFKHAHFVAYWTSAHHGNIPEAFRSIEFTTPHVEPAGCDITESELIDIVKDRMANSEYELDGIILTQLDNVAEGFETGTINPKCSRKFKIGISDNEAESTVLGITWQISKNYKFTPVLEIEPVEVSGALISRITGHNYANVIEKRCGIGSRIRFVRAGLVIPQLTEVLVPSDDFALPETNYAIDGVNIVLAPEKAEEPNEYTVERDIQLLEAAGKKLEIEHLGYGNCKKLYWACLSDNITLTPYTLFALPQGLIADVIGENGKKIEASLEERKKTLTEPLFAAACGAFGPAIGQRILTAVYEKYNTLNVTREQLEALEGFGETRIHQYWCRVDYWRHIKGLMAKCGILFDYVEDKPAVESNGIVACFSGVRDKELAERICQAGGIVADGWKKSVNCLIVKDPTATSSKIVKAREAGCEVISLEDAQARY